MIQTPPVHCFHTLQNKRKFYGLKHCVKNTSFKCGLDSRLVKEQHKDTLLTNQTKSYEGNGVFLMIYRIQICKQIVQHVDPSFTQQLLQEEGKKCLQQVINLGVSFIKVKVGERYNFVQLLLRQIDEYLTTEDQRSSKFFSRRNEPVSIRILFFKIAAANSGVPSSVIHP